MESFLKKLRQAYPNMSVLEFVRIYEKYRESNELLEKLDEAEKEPTFKKLEGEERIRELQKKLSVSEQHHLLHFMVPADIDLEHAQAILMYGFLMPGREKVFIGGKVLPEHHVRENVEHKLGFRFSRAKYDIVLAYFKKEGVIIRHSSGGRDEALSLRSSPTERGAGEHGAQILRVALEFARQKKRGNGK